MRAIRSALLALLLLPVFAAAQTPAPAPTKEQMLDYVLRAWEQSMTQLNSFALDVRRTTTDKTFGGVEAYDGWAKFLKSGGGQPSRALLYMEKKGDKTKYEKFLYTGTYLYEYVPATKVLRVHDVPQPKAGQPGIEDNILGLLFGMKADDAKRRYQMTWVPDPKHNNKFYHYLQILPRTPQDKADFTEARLVLTAGTFLPRQVWYHQPNGNEVTWDFDKVNVNVKIALDTFAPPQTLEKGWRVERIQPTAAPAAPGAVAPKK